MAMIRPPSRIIGSARCASRLSASAFVSRHQRQCLSFISIAGFSTPEAAFEITTSTRSNVRPNASNISATLPGSPTLACSAIARRPSARSSAHSASASSWLL